MLRPFVRKVQHVQRRTLATGTVYVSHLPTWANEKTLRQTAELHAHVYGVWTSPPPTQPNMHSHKHPTHDRKAAVRITTEQVPDTIEAMSHVAMPTHTEIAHCQKLLLDIIEDLKMQGIRAMPISKDPGLFQTGAREALGLGIHTRRFDIRTSSTPLYTRGLVDGYREGFLEARRKADIADLLKRCNECEDELEFMTEYFEHSLK
ncbi:hypothetical protein GGF49_003255 [Coemansia sp. RSA 1853]|nr:hypothetical protein GGF49_003255 [Coemansia sp. RSA 1853]